MGCPTVRLLDNTFDGLREIKGYTKEQVLEVKKVISELKSDKSQAQELKDFLENKFKMDPLHSYLSYLEKVKKFLENYILPKSQFDYFYIKSAIFDELQLI